MSTLNVQDYGAVGDGRNDDTRAIQSAIDDATAGDTVYFPEPSAEYLISQTSASGWGILRILGNTHADDMTLAGDGAGTVIKVDDGQSDAYICLDIDPENGIEGLVIRDLEIDGNRSNQSGTHNGGHGIEVKSNNASSADDVDISLRNIRVSEAFGPGFRIATSGVTVDSCTTDGSNRHGFGIPAHGGPGGGEAKLTNCLAVDTGADPGFYGFDAHGGNIVIEDCVAEPEDRGLKISMNAVSVTFRRVRVRGAQNHNYNTTSSPPDCNVTFEDLVFEGGSGTFRINEGTHTLVSGSDLVITGVNPSRVPVLGAGDSDNWQFDGTFWLNDVTDEDGMWASGGSTGYISDFRHSGIDGTPIRSSGGIDIQNVREEYKTDIEGVPTADEVGAWSGGTDTTSGDDETESVDDDGDSEVSFESWTPQWASVHGDYSVVETASSEGDALLALEPESPGRHFLSWDDVGEPKDTDVVVLTRVVSNEDAFTSWCRPIVRGSGSAGSENGYFAAVWPDELHVRKYIDGELTTLATTETAPNVGEWLYLRFRVTGNELKLRKWTLGDSEPTTWDLETTDDDISSGGLAGVGGVSADTQYWDYVSIATDGGTARVHERETALETAWVSPTDGETVEGTVPVRIDTSGSDDDEELTVEYRLNEDQWSAAEYDPDTGYHEGTMDTADASSGSHTLTARATDPDGETAEASISVSIEADTSPTVESFSVSDVGSDEELAEFDASWRVSDTDADLESVELVLTRESDGTAVDEATVDIDGSEASDTTSLAAEKDAGSDVRYLLELVVTDRNENTASETASVTSYGSGDPPVINRLSVSEAGYNDSDAEVSVLWSVSAPDDGLDSVEIDVTDSNGTSQGVTWSLNGTRASDIDTFSIKGGGDETFDVTVSVTNVQGESIEEATSITA